MQTPIPVPQADDLDTVFSVAQLVADGQTTSAEIAAALELVPRQGEYYAAAAEQLGLVVRDKTTNEYRLLPWGNAYVQSGDDLAKRRRLRRLYVFSHPIIEHLGSGLGISRPRFRDHGHLFEDLKYVADSIEELGLADVTALRRAYTIKAWMKALAA